MLIREIIPAINPLVIDGSVDTEFSEIRFDSRSVRPGDLFVAISGTSSDGHDFIEKALDLGASSIICERLPESTRNGICYLRVKSSAQALGLVASAFFGSPSSKLQLIGITGTNGKTTCATLLYELFRGLGFKTGLISTITNMVDETSIPSTHTTPDPLQLNALLAQMVDQGCTYCFMEVSSHAVDQQRIAGLAFRGGIFTNLTHDHLDYHKTFDAYLKAKKFFFDSLPIDSFALVNKDDRNGMVMQQNTKASKYTYSVQSMADFRCRIIENHFQGLYLNIDEHEAWFRLTGRFNAYNIVSVYGAAILLHQNPEEVLKILSNLRPVNGRFNSITSPSGVTAIVDYAHTPDALKNVLETIQDIRTGAEKVITVVGAGGNRDTTKRPVMARIACLLSDRVILTSDNPRNEEPEVIISQMKEGVEPRQSGKLLCITNREEAIKTACALAGQGDIILVAGKGHETYQEIRGVRHHFDDKEIIMTIFNSSNTVNP